MMKLFAGGVCFFFSIYAAAATTVVVKPLSDLLVFATQGAPARVINEDHAMISARVSAEVEDVLVQVGDRVKKGQPVLRLECRDYELVKLRTESALESLQAQTRLAKQQLTRAERLLKRQNAARELRDKRRAELDSLDAQRQGAIATVSEAELAVQRCSPVAPFDGVVTERLVSVGSLVDSGTGLLKVLNDANAEVSAALSFTQLENLKGSHEVSYQFAGKQYPLELRTTVPYVDNRARTQEVRLRFTAGASLSGSSGRINWNEPSGRLPVQYIVSRDGRLGLMQALQGKAEFVLLPTAIEGQAALVNLPLDSQIIVEGQHGVEAGQDVTLQNQL